VFRCGLYRRALHHMQCIATAYSSKPMAKFQHWPVLSQQGVVVTTQGCCLGLSMWLQGNLPQPP
jgi:hypothetical protein